MLGPSEFRALVSGQRRGAFAALARAALRTLEIPYSTAVRWRNRRYDSGRARITRVGVPVVSVGNLTLGGTGKTPTVEWLARWFTERGVRVALVSRGYGSQAGRVNDEALELAKLLPNVPHVQDANRVRGAQRAIAEHRCQLIILDDGFQHRRIARDFDLVLVDALEPFGFGHVFPRGTLREPLACWSRAHAILLTRAELLNADQRGKIRDEVLRYAPHAVWAEATHAPEALESSQGVRQPLQSLAGQSIAAFCGLGNPAGFRHALAGCGYRVVAMREFADHHPYTEADIETLAAWVDALDVAAVVCTGKDLVKIANRWRAKTPLWALSSRLQILAGQCELETALAPLVLSQRLDFG
ncbi:MAG: tetraacyldisaccharide 4'-kinase [Pirellulales bacterium]